MQLMGFALGMFAFIGLVTLLFIWSSKISTKK